jgi:hypothetical protein
VKTTAGERDFYNFEGPQTRSNEKHWKGKKNKIFLENTSNRGKTSVKVR